MQREGSRTELKARGGAAVCLMKLKILSWNVRGLNEEEKRMRIKGLIREWMEDIVYLQETKLQFINREVLRVYGVVLMWIGVFLGSRGASGGILIMWIEGC
jgi:hypothetical protein